MTLNDRLTTLRSLFAAPPGAVAWNNLTACFDDAPSDDLNVLLPYAQQHLQAWPDATRKVPLQWLKIEPLGHPALILCHSLNHLISASDDHHAHLIARSPYLENICILQIYTSGLTGDGLEAVLQSPHLQAIRSLELADTDLGDAVLLHLQARSVHRLTHLRLVRTRITSAGLSALAASPHLAGLQQLSLPDNPFGDDGAAILLQSSHLTQLQHLDLSGCSLGRAFGAHFAQATHLTQLRTLSLSGARLTPEGVRDLLASPHLQTLTTLSLNGVHCDDSLAFALAAATHLTELHTLDLGYNDLTDAGAQALAASPHLASLRCLTLDGNPLSDPAAEAFAASPYFAQLESLNLTSCNLSPLGAKALAKSPYLRLHTLNLERNTLDLSAKRALRKRFPSVTF